MTLETPKGVAVSIKETKVHLLEGYAEANAGIFACGGTQDGFFCMARIFGCSVISVRDLNGISTHERPQRPPNSLKFIGFLGSTFSRFRSSLATLSRMSTRKPSIPIPAVHSSVSPDAFVERMVVRWRSFDLEVSDELRTSWRRMAEAFGYATLDGMGLAEPMGDRSNVWRALQLPTGTGKTQGTALYAAMLADKNRQAEPDQPKSGILFVTALIKEADKFAAMVNDLAGYKCAAARHSDTATSVSFDKLADYDVLAITHQAYLTALGHELDGEDYGKLSDYLKLVSGRRVLTVVDESISNLVWTALVSEQDLLLSLAGAIHEVRAEFSWLVNDVHQLRDAIGKTTELLERPTSAKQLWRNGRSTPEWNERKADIERLGRALRDVLKPLLSPHTKKASWITEHVNKTLEAYRALGDGYGLAVRKGRRFFFGTSRLMLPDEMPGPVVLDATASQQPLWGLLGAKAAVLPAVSGTRSYANLTLSVARLRGIGKTSMEECNKGFVDQALASLPRGQEQAATFLCVHKGLEAKLKAGALNKEGVQVDHWGNIDGRNDWKDCSRGVFLGLPYFPPEWPKMVKLAVHAAHHNATETDQLLIGLPDRLKVSDDELSDARIAAALVQAINRIRCRKVIDSYGNCPAAEAFVTLPPGRRGDRILSRLKLELPGVKTARWEFAPSDELSVSKAEYAEGLLAAVRDLGQGEYLLDDVTQPLALTPSQRKNLGRALSNKEHPLSRSVAELDVVFQPGRGRGNKARLIVSRHMDAD